MWKFHNFNEINKPSIETCDQNYTNQIKTKESAIQANQEQ